MSKLILISAGHSETDPGAVGNGQKEAKIAVAYRDLTAKILRDKGLSVVEDGADGINEPLTKAILLAQKSDVAVEFHLNASANPQANGIECLSLPELRAFSQKLSAAIAFVTKGKLRNDKGFLDQSAGNHHRLGFCIAGGVIIELGFISNKAELQKILDNKNEICSAIADVIAAEIGYKVSPAIQPKPANSLSDTAGASSASYTVKTGDTAGRIAKATGVKLEDLKRLNNLDANYTIKLGQVLKLK